MVEMSEQLVAQLEREYIPLDTALIRALVSDYDITDPRQLRTLREFLDALKASALTDDAEVFDPSGTSGSGPDSSPYMHQPTWDRSTEILSEDTDNTNLSNGLSQLEIRSISSNELDAEGITVINDIEAQSTTTKEARLVELFPSQKPADIAYVLQKSDGSFMRAMDVLLNHVFFTDAAEIDQEKIPLHSIDAFSEEHHVGPSKRRKGKKKRYRPLSQADADVTVPMKIVPQYARYQEEGDSTPSNSAAVSGTPTPPSGSSAAALLAARGTAFTKAIQYHRKGNPLNLLGAAAAYYSQVGRDYDTALKAATAAEADTLVAAQSSATLLDLHGVCVKDATRIASQRVSSWWEGLGEGRIRGPKSTVGDGYRIVTGVGRHSDGGVGKIGPAVTRLLVKQGWKVEVGSGELRVTGVVRKR